MKLEELMLRLNTARGLEIPASVCVKKHWHMTKNPFNVKDETTYIVLCLCACLFHLNYNRTNYDIYNIYR